MNWRPSFTLSRGRAAVVVAIGLAALLVTSVALIPMAMVGGASLFLSAGAGCPSPAASASQPAATTAASNSVPADYLALFKQIGQQYGVPWVILAGIGKVESNDGQSNLPGVHSGQNGFGAAGPMQIGIGSASTNTWGGAPVHPASEVVSGVATDANGDGIASVYEPADAIAGAAKYLLRNGVQSNVSGAIFAYNHLASYVQQVEYWAGVYSRGGYVLTNSSSTVTAPECLTSVQTAQVPNQAVAAAITFAREQLGKPYLWGGTGPDAFDCSGLVMMAYRAAGISIPRTSEQQWAWGPQIPASQVRPGDLVFFAGSDGTTASPGHVGLVIGNHMMIEAYATGFPIRISSFGSPGAAAGDGNPVGFTRPWSHAGVTLQTAAAGG
jgi:cell wall-associated NlpC family hydrolase